MTTLFLYMLALLRKLHQIVACELQYYESKCVVCSALIFKGNWIRTTAALRLLGLRRVPYRCAYIDSRTC
ncbi:hypothetical protein MRB53_035786 [Persea americana]|uniref:Uncharacterized protein n=1 Tax=Persea americana TaxID=3435 RepID=A0ACC2K5M0_PERAE|nr:hypothetical protein MRB53_035786 [Persea americana]